MNFEEAIKNEKIRNVMVPRGIVVTRKTTYGQVVAQLQGQKRFAAIILDKQKVVGIFTERDALKRGLLQGASPETPIEQLMTPDPVIVDPDDNLAVAIRLMHEGKYRHLPIVDRNNQYLGIVSVRDIVMYLSENYPYEVYNQPPDPHKVSAAPEGA